MLKQDSRIVKKSERGGGAKKKKVMAARLCSYAYTIAGDGAVDLTSLVAATVVVTVDTGLGAETIFTGRVACSLVVQVVVMNLIRRS